MGNLTDQALLAGIAKSDKHWRVRKAAVRNLTDQSAIVDVAKADSEGSVRQTAVGRLTNQAVLADIVKMDPDASVREAAIRNPNLTDQAVLVDVARDDSLLVRVSVAKRLDPVEHEDLISRIEREEERAKKREEAEERYRLEKIESLREEIESLRNAHCGECDDEGYIPDYVNGTCSFRCSSCSTREEEISELKSRLWSLER